MFIVLGDDNSRRRSRPVAVSGILLACCVIFVIQLLVGETLIGSLALVPHEVTHNLDLDGAVTVLLHGKQVTISHGPAPGSPYITFLTSIFLHGSFLHLALNMLGLWVFADQIEDRFGTLKFLGLYALCGCIAGLVQVGVHPESVVPMLGASGAITGMMGAYLVFYPRNRLRVLVLLQVLRIPAAHYLTLFFVLQVIDMLTTRDSGLAYGAHVGGFLTGAAVALLTRKRSDARLSLGAAEPLQPQP